MDGVFGLSRSFDGIGLMAKITADVVMLAECVICPEAKAFLLSGSLNTLLRQDWNGMSVGLLDPAVSGLPSMVLVPVST